MNNPFRSHLMNNGIREEGGPIFSQANDIVSNADGSSDEAVIGSPADLSTANPNSLYSQHQPNTSILAPFSLIPGKFPQPIGIQPADAPLLIPHQAHQVTTASQAVPGALCPTDTTSPPLPGQQPPGGTTTFSPPQRQTEMPGILPCQPTFGLPPMSMLPQTIVPQPINPTQWHAQATPWQFGTGGVPGWPPVSTNPLLWMYPMYPNACPNFQTSPPVNPAIVSPMPESSKAPLSRGTSSGLGPSALPPPYSQSQGSNKSQVLSRNKASDVVDQGNVPPVRYSPPS
jgi:hypothetical protein